MRTKLTLSLLASLMALGVTSPINADTVFDSEIQAKIARYKVNKKLAWSKLSGDERATRLRKKELSGFGAEPSLTPCGAIDLGNVTNASITQGARAVTVIIDGDVINADNHCR